MKKLVVDFVDLKVGDIKVWYEPDKVFLEQFFMDEKGIIYGFAQGKAVPIPKEDYEIKPCAYVYDKNGDCIYQDDIIQVTYHDLFDKVSQYVGIAQYKSGMWYLIFPSEGVEIPLYEFLDVEYDDPENPFNEGIQVIGNCQEDAVAYNKICGETFNRGQNSG